MNKIKFFKTFRGHGKQLLPVDEIQFTETESLPTYYCCWYGKDNKIERFVKYAVTRFEERRRFVLEVSKKPKNLVYFNVDDSLSTQTHSATIEYLETEGKAKYYCGIVSDDGKSVYANRYERTVVIDEAYASNSSSVMIAMQDLIAAQNNLETILEVGSFQQSVEEQVHINGIKVLDIEKEKKILSVIQSAAIAGVNLSAIGVISGLPVSLIANLICSRDSTTQLVNVIQSQLSDIKEGIQKENLKKVVKQIDAN